MIKMEIYRELFEERAAIIEFDGGQSRNKSELLAKDEVFKLYREEGGLLDRVKFDKEFNRYAEIDNNNF